MMDGGVARGPQTSRLRAPARRVEIALQGGGAHGAFTWGVLDRLLEEERVGLGGISAASTGAMNTAVFASGMSADGREGAKKALGKFWRRISQATLTSPVQPTLLDRLFGQHSMGQSRGFVFSELMARLFLPYEFSPFGQNLLRNALLDSVDFTALTAKTYPIKLYLAATNVRTGKVKVFAYAEISVDPVLASACLPFLFQAVEIDGGAYWDGGHTGNPPIFPLIYNCSSGDVLIVQLSPTRREELPHRSIEILNRVNGISFNSSLIRQMRAILFVTQLIDDGYIVNGSLRRMRIHAVAADDVMTKLSVASKLDADSEFLTGLRDIGRQRAERWLDAHFDSLGVESTMYIQARLHVTAGKAARPIVSPASGRLRRSSNKNLFPATLNLTKGVHHAARQQVFLIRLSCFCRRRRVAAPRQRRTGADTPVHGREVLWHRGRVPERLPDCDALLRRRIQAGSRRKFLDLCPSRHLREDRRRQPQEALTRKDRARPRS